MMDISYGVNNSNARSEFSDGVSDFAAPDAAASKTETTEGAGVWSKVKALPDYIPPVVKHYGQQAMIGAAGAALLGAAVQYTWNNVDSAIGRLASTLLGTQRPASPEVLDVVKAYASVMANYGQYGAAAGLGAAFKTPMTPTAAPHAHAD